MKPPYPPTSIMFEISEAIKTQLGKRSRFICELCSDDISTDIPRCPRDLANELLKISKGKVRDKHVHVNRIKDYTTAVGKRFMSIPQKLKIKLP